MTRGLTIARMPTETRTCTSCRSPLPYAAAFCPACGTATPVGIDSTTGEFIRPEARDVAAAEHAQRLQRALGPGYELRHLLGRGGFSEVYAAWDARLKRSVAVKTFRADLVVSETLLARFQREAEAVAKLRHPHVVPIYAVGEDHGLAYYTMPLLEGESLAAALDRMGVFDVSDACRILREAAGALAAAHRAGIVHRDIKPDNIILEGPERNVVVMDFGIAKVADAEHGLTGTGMLVGTPHYMSPEQATGERDIDARSDQYSLAVVGYRMLTGHPPFDATSVQALLMKQITEVPQPVHELRPEVPPAVSQALSRALSKDPAARFASMSEFAAALGSVDRPTGDSGTSRRRVPDLATRAREAQLTIARWRLPAIAGALIGFAAFAALVDSTTAAPVRVMTARRGDAAYAAKAFLASRGVTGEFADYLDFHVENDLFRFLQRSLRADAALARSSEDGSVWRWTLRRYDRPRQTVWKADVGPRGGIVGFAHLVPDTVSGARLEPDSARRIAERELERAGLELSELRLVQDARHGRPSRTDYTFAWERAASAIPWRGDTARHRITVELTGDRVSSFQRRTVPPPSFERTPAARIALSAIAWAVIIGAAMAAGVVASRRARTGALQWAAARRVALINAVLSVLFVGAFFVYPETVPEEPGGRSLGQLVAMGIGIGMVFGVMILAASLALLAGDALAQEYHPTAIVGIGDVARGRLSAPELTTGALMGYAAGLVVAGFTVVATWLGSRFLGQPIGSGVTDLFEFVWPSLWVLGSASSALFLMPALFYGSMLARSWRLPPLAACTLPAAVGAMAVLGNKSAFEAFIIFVEMLVPTLLAWRFGLLAGVLCVFVSGALPAVWALLRSGTADFVSAGLVAATLFALPAVLGVISYRRLGSLAGGASPRVPTPATS
jgi:tRNA A-37 threonylcarbamoyl transferase component Bud32